MTRYLVAMSGGLDSAAVAAMLVEAGHEVIGSSLRLVDEEGDGPRSCCSAEDLSAARRSCDRLGIAHYVFDQRRRFAQEIISPFVEAYLDGQTPNPCIYCNQFFKFGELLQRAQAMNARLATGHYVQKIMHDDAPLLARPIDLHKDQSYFLYRISPAALKICEFPLGGMRKAEVREWAESRGLLRRNKKESQEICFAPQGAANFVEEQASKRIRVGNIVDQQGHKIAEHAGVHRYTIGQRRGLGLGGGGQKIFVSAIDGYSSTITVGDKKALEHRSIQLEEVKLFVSTAQLVAASAQNSLFVQIRARHKAVTAKVSVVDKTRLQIDFEQAQSAPAPGQSAVFYLNNKYVLGGGIII